MRDFEDVASCCWELDLQSNTLRLSLFENREVDL